ncbi:MAG: DUF1292 domain-containing protein [Ndongobacter sp.]|nr:DUF1292 domain-containing protein [Ndongobacter sp.]
MAEQTKIWLNDGEGDVEMTLIASFGLDDEDYCCLEDETGERYILRMHEDGDEMLFESIENDEEFDEARTALEELLEERASAGE